LLVCTALHAVDARSTTLSQLLAPRKSHQSGVLPKLRKATVIDPMASGGAEEALTNLAKLLGKEPPAASEDADALLEDEDSEDVMSAEDLALMGEDSCDKDPSTPKCAAKSEESSFIEKDEEEETPENKEQSGTDLLQISESQSKRSSHSGSSSGSGSTSSSSSMSPVEKEIRKLENMIRKAMKVSHTIPDAVKRLEELKQASEKETEERARQEATKTLEEHRRLMSEMGEHITKLQNKLNELVAKRAQLSASDSRLRRELGQFGDASSSSHSSSASELSTAA